MSNRAEFLEMREQEAFENPQDHEHSEEKEPDKEVSELERRANNYLAGIERNRLRASVKHAINHHDAIYSKKKDHSGIDFNPNFIGPVQMTDLEKSRFVYEASEETRKYNLEKMEGGFENLRRK